MIGGRHTKRMVHKTMPNTPRYDIVIVLKAAVLREVASRTFEIA